MKSIECDFTGTGIYAGQSKVYTVNTNSPTGLQPVSTVSAARLSVYPNPAVINEPVSVVWKEDKLSSEAFGWIDFYTLTGTRVASCEMNGGKASVSFNKSGLYIGRLQGKNPVNNIKVLVK